MTKQAQTKKQFTAQEQELIEILSWKRGHDTAGEHGFRQWLIKQLPKEAVEDDIGNIHYEAGKGKRTLFSCHVDTVHQEPLVEKQQVLYDANYDELLIGKNDECLGADDGAGIWIMLQLIRAKVPGYYIFHRGEECGGIGANWIVKNKGKEFLTRFYRAIAFDRRGTTDIITHQGTRTASNKFAQALADMLNKNTAFKFAPCPNGTFTDTKIYAPYIPECTNISVGYNQQHGSNESQRLGFLVDLTEKLKVLSWETLPVERDPLKDNESAYKRSGLTWGQMKQQQQLKPVKPKSDMDIEELEVMVHRFPKAAAAMLHTLGVKWDDLRHEIHMELSEDDDEFFNL